MASKMRDFEGPTAKRGPSRVVVSGSYKPHFAEASPPNQSRHSTTKGQVRKGRRVPTNRFQIAAFVRAKQASEREARGSKIKFHCRDCGDETDSGHAVSTLCLLCVARRELEPDRRTYAALSAKIARYRAEGISVRSLLPQVVRVHNRILRRIAETNSAPERAAKAMEKLLEGIRVPGPRIKAVKSGDLLRELGDKVKT